MAKGKEVSQAELSEIIGKSVVTVRAWEKEGMPVLSKSGRGRASTYNTVDVLEWMEARILEKYAQQPAGPDVTEDEARRRKVFAEAQLAEVKLGLERGELVPIELVGSEVDSMLSRVRAKLLAIPGNLALKLTNEPDPAVIRDRIFDQVSGALNELSNSSFDSDDGPDEATQPPDEGMQQ